MIEFGYRDPAAKVCERHLFGVCLWHFHSPVLINSYGPGFVGFWQKPGPLFNLFKTHFFNQCIVEFNSAKEGRIDSVFKLSCT